MPSFADLEAMTPVRSHRASSTAENWENGNFDARSIPAGTTRVIAELEGPGIIRHLWFTQGGTDPFYPRRLVLRIYWDGSDTPAVESPIGDFFGVGHGLRRDLTSEPVVVSSFGKAYNCYWPMPFAKHAKVTLSNEAADHDCAVYWNIDWGELDELPPNTPYFHARYRQEFPSGDSDYLILDTQGAGYYIGTVLSVRLRTSGWFGEGDERVVIDGENPPTILGTGTEDYFCQAWGLHQMSAPYYGAPVVEGWRPGERICAYRWHIPAPIMFHKLIRFTMEHKNFTISGEKESWSYRHDDFSSVAFWYQTGVATPGDPLPPPDERLYKVVQIELEDTDIASIAAPEGTEIKREAQTQSSGFGRLTIDNKDPKGEIAIPFTLENADRYRPTLFINSTDQSGIFDVFIDDQLLKADVDFGNKREMVPEELPFGWLDLAAGEHQLRFFCKGTTTGGYVLWPDTLQLLPESTLKD